MSRERIIWVDNVKVIAISLVVLGHFFQSMISANIIQDSAAISFFETFIYYFHVPLFFMCSGFLYQKYSQVRSFSQWGQNVLKKLIAFSVPYFVFNIASYILKTAFSDYVNNQTESLVSNLFIEPLPPYWFLLTLFLIFVITPTFGGKKQISEALAVSFAVYVFIGVQRVIDVPTAINSVMIYEFWFVLGMWIAVFDIEKLFSFGAAAIFAISPLAALLGERYSVPGIIIRLICGLSACFGIIGFTGRLYKNGRQTPVMGFAAKYTMPVFLMHTIFAAGVRAILLKIGISSPAIHIAAGIAASFALPVISQIIMDKIHLDFLVYPLRYLKPKQKRAEK